MKELDIEIIERDNNIPPEKSILAKQTRSELYEALKEFKQGILGLNRPLFKIVTKRVYGEPVEFKATNYKRRGEYKMKSVLEHDYYYVDENGCIRKDRAKEVKEKARGLLVRDFTDAAHALRHELAKALYGPNFDEERAKAEYLERKLKKEQEYNHERWLFANKYFGLPDYVPGGCMDGIECLSYCSADDQKKFEKAWEEHWDDYLDKKEYESLRRSVDQEKYHDFLEKRINSSAIGDEFDILYYGDYDQSFMWDLADWEDYVEILYTTADSVRIRILKHYKEEKIK